MITTRRFPRFVFALLAILIVSGAAKNSDAAELVMFEQSFCEWCDVWEEEVGIVYEMTSEGKRIPIRKVNIHDDRPGDLSNLKPVIFTPTFVLVESGKEVGRITGYPGEDFFWSLLNKMIEDLRAVN